VVVMEVVVIEMAMRERWWGLYMERKNQFIEG
jgi:hypothetical protein